MFGQEYILYRIKYYTKYSSLNIHEYMQDGGRTTPSPCPLQMKTPSPAKPEYMPSEEHSSSAANGGIL